MARVTLQGVRKTYENGHVAVHGVDLDVADGEFVVLVGPSGCGKSTTLRMVAGLESITAGRLTIGERVVNDVPPRDRDIAMVFQNYALYPHMSVFQNMAFALKLRKLPATEIDRRVREAAQLLGLGPELERLPRQLSGGQRQRVAIGRAIVRQPAVFLFDEPLSNLDAQLRVQTRREITRLHRDLKATVLYVTHDQVEAMTMGDRIVVLEAGRVQQVDTPMGLYERPRNLFVATFIGSPSMNLLNGTVTVDGSGNATFHAVGADAAAGHAVVPHADSGHAAADDLELQLGRHPSASAAVNTPVVLGLRPEQLSLVPTVAVRAQDAPPVTQFPLKLEAVEPLGNEILLHGRIAGHELTARVAPVTEPPRPGETVTLAIDTVGAHIFDATSGARIVDARATA